MSSKIKKKKQLAPKVSAEQMLEFLEFSRNLKMNPAQKAVFIAKCIPLLCELIKQLTRVDMTLIALIECNESLLATGTEQQSQIGQSLINSVTTNQRMRNETNRGLN